MTGTHVDASACKTLLQGELSLARQRVLQAHIRHCPQCLARYARVRGELQARGDLPPLVFYHPLEIALSYVQRFVFLPLWVWNLFLYAIIYVGWLLFVDMSHVFWLRDPWRALWPQIPMAIATSYFYIVLGRLRDVIRFLWEAGIPYSEVEALSMKGVAPIFGHLMVQTKRFVLLVPGWLTMLGLLCTAQVLFWIWTPQMYPTRDEIVAQLFLLYDHQVRAAAMWAIIWGVLFVVRMAHTLQHYRLRDEDMYYRLQRKLRALVLVSLNVGALTWAIWTPLTMYKEGRWPAGWGELDIFLLLFLLFGYLFLEWRLIYPHLPRVGRWAHVQGTAEVFVTVLVIVTSPFLQTVLTW